MLPSSIRNPRCRSPSGDACINGRCSQFGPCLHASCTYGHVSYDNLEFLNSKLIHDRPFEKTFLHCSLPCLEPPVSAGGEHMSSQQGQWVHAKTFIVEALCTSDTRSSELLYLRISFFQSRFYILVYSPSTTVPRLLKSLRELAFVSADVTSHSVPHVVKARSYQLHL